VARHFIDGVWISSDGGQEYTVIDPSTNSGCTRSLLGTARDVEKAVVAARAAQPAFARWSVADRLALLVAIREGLQARTADIAASITDEIGCPITLSRTAQLSAGCDQFDGMAEVLATFAFEQSERDALIVHEPIGVVGMITPWNWPLNQIGAKVAAALAAGNACILKPSEECPTNAAILADIIAEAGAPPGIFNLVLGDGAGVGAALASAPGVDMISFTGSTRAGIAIAQAAAATVKRVHQELGGKTPNIIIEGADLEAVMPGSMYGIFCNSGQSCIAPTRILVHRSQHAEAARLAGEIAAATRVGDPREEGDHIGPVVNERQWLHIQKLIAGAERQGATLVAGGTGRPHHFATGCYVRPTVFSGVDNHMAIAREEVFGPVATLIPYDDDEDAIRIANDSVYGLSASVSGPPAEARRFVRRLHAGSVVINGWAPPSRFPFGGYKQSGNGREGGVQGLRDFCEVKTIHGLTD